MTSDVHTTGHLRNSLEEFTKMLATGGPTSLDDQVVRDMKFMEFSMHNGESDMLGSSDLSSPSQLFQDSDSTSSPNQDFSSEVDTPNFSIPPINTFPQVQFPPVNVPMQTEVPPTGFIFPPIIKTENIVKTEDDDVKRKKRKVNSDEGMSCEFAPYRHHKRPSFRLFEKTQVEITNTLDFIVRADKNLHYSDVDDAFILYKQNQFQVNIDIPTIADKPPSYYLVEVSKGIVQQVERFVVGIYGVKQNRRELNMDEDEQLIQVFQTGKSRAKEDSQIAEPCIVKNGSAALSRLRFQSSTANNAKTKNNEVNPNQQYFRLIVTLNAQCNGTFYEVSARISERIIVRGQNPGRYSAKGSPKSSQTINLTSPMIPPVPPPKADATVFTGKVGINTADPQQALEVHGNIMVTGNLLKPSDMRVKEDFKPVSTAQSLQNIENLKIFDYNLKEWTDPGVTKQERGVIAQDLQKVMPYAVETFGDVHTKDGQVIQNLLVVNERVLLFENIGATQELGKILREELDRVDEIDDRVDNIEEEEKKILRGEMHNRGKIDKVIDYVTQEDLDDPSSACCYVSIFGLGPAWSAFVIGWVFPPAWLVGILFLASWKSSFRRWAGAACLGSLAFSALFWYIVWALHTRKMFPANEAFGWGISAVVYLIFGAFLMFVLTIYINRRNRFRRKARLDLRRSLAKQYTRRPKFYSFSSTNNSSRLPSEESMRLYEAEQEKKKKEYTKEDFIVDAILDSQKKKKDVEMQKKVRISEDLEIATV